MKDGELSCNVRIMSVERDGRGTYDIVEPKEEEFVKG